MSTLSYISSLIGRAERGDPEAIAALRDPSQHLAWALAGEEDERIYALLAAIPDHLRRGQAVDRRITALQREVGLCPDSHLMLCAEKVAALYAAGLSGRELDALRDQIGARLGPVLAAEASASPRWLNLIDLLGRASSEHPISAQTRSAIQGLCRELRIEINLDRADFHLLIPTIFNERLAGQERYRLISPMRVIPAVIDRECLFSCSMEARAQRMEKMDRVLHQMFLLDTMAAIDDPIGLQVAFADLRGLGEEGYNEKLNQRFFGGAYHFLRRLHPDLLQGNHDPQCGQHAFFGEPGYLALTRDERQRLIHTIQALYIVVDMGVILEPDEITPEDWALVGRRLHQLEQITLENGRNAGHSLEELVYDRARRAGANVSDPQFGRKVFSPEDRCTAPRQCLLDALNDLFEEINPFINQP